MKAIFELDTTIKEDASKLIQIANILKDRSIPCSNSSYPNASNYELTQPNSELKISKETLENKINIYEEQIKVDKNEIKELTEKLEEQINKVQILEKQIENKDSEIANIKKLNDQLLDVEQSKNIKLTETLDFLKIENNDLKKKLEQYEPISVNIGEEAYFQIENNKLSRTMRDKAPYIVRVTDNNTYRFHFNTISGPILEACAPNSELLVFCEVLEREENANHILQDAWGIASPDSNGKLIIENKARIKLIRI